MNPSFAPRVGKRREGGEGRKGTCACADEPAHEGGLAKKGYGACGVVEKLNLAISDIHDVNQRADIGTVAIARHGERAHVQLAVDTLWKRPTHSQRVAWGVVKGERDVNAWKHCFHMSVCKEGRERSRGRERGGEKEAGREKSRERKRGEKEAGREEKEGRERSRTEAKAEN